MPIPVIDLFAGPGGLGEGFSSLPGENGPAFKIKLSIEKDAFAHRTLELRAFFRQFPREAVPDEYYSYLTGTLKREDLFKKFPEQAAKAAAEAWHAELGGEKFPDQIIDERIEKALGSRINWVLIGGPPCQAYSLVGRSKIIGEIGIEKYEVDHRHFLYREYLRIIARHQPPVFVMENVKGLLSATINKEKIFPKIRADLQNPLDAIYGKPQRGRQNDLKYKLVSLSAETGDLLGDFQPEDFVVRTELYGIPQARHRIILIGIRDDYDVTVPKLKQEDQCTIEDVISDLPRVRSGLSKEDDSGELWRSALLAIPDAAWFTGSDLDDEVRREMRKLLKEIDSSLDRGSDFLKSTSRTLKRHAIWFADDRLKGVCNHSTRSHIRKDLHRYFFVSCFARVHRRSPLLNDFPKRLLPKHENVEDALEETKFNDRFRVQREGKPATTITSHISKDGHYFIHYDPTQCRSLTVREAARLQTFPDNYFFDGPRTQQYHQVGNAVPPLLASKIAQIIAATFW